MNLGDPTPQGANPEPKKPADQKLEVGTSTGGDALFTRLTTWRSPPSFSKRIDAAITIDGLRKSTLFANEEAHAHSNPNCSNLQGSCYLGTNDTRALQEAALLLRSTELKEMIHRGEITLALIKPQADKNRGLGADDEQAASLIQDKVLERGGQIVFSFDYKFGPEAINRFYGSEKERLSKIPAGDGITVWDTIETFMQSGPLTVLLLRRPEGDAVQWWRDTMGKTNPKDAAPGTIRGDHAIVGGLPNNLVHGSDSPQSVEREVGFVATSLERLLERNAVVEQSFPSEQILRDVGILGESELLSRVLGIHDRGRSGESYVYGLEVTSVAPDGTVRNQRIKEKNIISLGGPAVCDLKIRTEMENMKVLSEAGVRVTRIYGRTQSALYEEFVRDDATAKRLGDLERARELSDQDKVLLEKLCGIARVLDAKGYRPLNFLSDLLYDGKDFVMIDLGRDLGSPSNKPGTDALDQLHRVFYHHSAFVDQYYHQQ